MAINEAVNIAVNVSGTQTVKEASKDFKGLSEGISSSQESTANLMKATQGVVAGMQVAAGAVGLFGSKSEELEKILLKVQSAMALSQGLKDFQEFVPAIKNVASSFTGVLTKSVQSFGKAARTAIAATGIGLLVVAVGGLLG